MLRKSFFSDVVSAVGAEDDEAAVTDAGPLLLDVAVFSRLVETACRKSRASLSSAVMAAFRAERRSWSRFEGAVVPLKGAIGACFPAGAAVASLVSSSRALPLPCTQNQIDSSRRILAT